MRESWGGADVDPIIQFTARWKNLRGSSTYVAADVSFGASGWGGRITSAATNMNVRAGGKREGGG